MSKWKKYRRNFINEMRPYVLGEDMSKIAFDDLDVLEQGGMVSRNPKNHEDQWYIPKAFFEDNMELAL